jgi:hypothetical protein
MTLTDIQFIFNRAFSLTFERKKLLLAFIVLAFSGLLVVFCRALALNAGPWITLSLTFLPIFLCAGLLLSAGILLIRVYHDEIKQRPFRYRDIAANSWELIIGASYFAIPIILVYLLLWMVLGFFFLLTGIPGLGEFFGVLLAFGPFLINFGSLVLTLLSLSMLFFVAPLLALNGMNRIRVTQILGKRLRKDVFSNLFLGIIALLPLAALFGLLFLSAHLTGGICFTCSNPVYSVVQWFTMMIPFAAVLSPAVVFFFNFAAEAHVLILKGIKNA